MGLLDRKNHNISLRARGIEPEPGLNAGLKRHARYLRRASGAPIVIQNPDKFLHSHARAMMALRRRISARS